MIIRNLHKERFMDMVGRSRGDITLHLAGGRTCSLKSDPVAAAMFRTMTMPEGGVEITFADAQDIPPFFRCMLDGAL